MSFYLYRGRLAAYGCELDLRRESIKSSEEGERENELITFIAADWPRMVASWI